MDARYDDGFEVRNVRAPRVVTSRGAEIFEMARDEKVVQKVKGRFLSLVLRGPSAERGTLAAAAG
jgi:hypothetical protein